MKTTLKIVLFIFISIGFCSYGEERIKMNIDESGIYTIPCEVNGLKLRFIFDTGASDVHLSLLEAAFMIKNGYITREDIIGTDTYSMADGSIEENAIVNLKEIKIGHISLKNVQACISSKINAPILLGQSAIRKMGKYTIDNDFLILHDSSVGTSQKTTNVNTGNKSSYTDYIPQKWGEFKWDNGDKYKGQWKNGNLHGQGTYYYHNGDKYVGNWIDNKREGYGVIYFADGHQYVGSWKDNMPNGNGIFTWNSGVKFIGTWQNGNPYGKGTFVYLDGTKKEDYWSDNNSQIIYSSQDLTNSYDCNVKKTTTIEAKTSTEQIFYLAQSTKIINLYDGPSTKNKILAQIPKGSTLFVIIESNDDFVRVVYLDKDIWGYVNRKYLTGFEAVNIDHTGELNVIGQSEYLDKAEIEIENRTNRNVSICVGNNNYKFSAHEKRTIILLAGTYNIIASSTGIIPYVGSYTVDGGRKYSWFFFIRSIKYGR